MAEYVFTAAVGAGNARLNAQLGQSAPRADVSTSEVAVPAILQVCRTLLVGHCGGCLLFNNSLHLKFIKFTRV